MSSDKVQWIIERQRTNREAYMTHPGVKGERDTAESESTKVDIAVEESQSVSVNFDMLESNPEVHIHVQKSELLQ